MTPRERRFLLGTVVAIFAAYAVCLWVDAPLWVSLLVIAVVGGIGYGVLLLDRRRRG